MNEPLVIMSDVLPLIIQKKNYTGHRVDAWI